MTTIAFKLPLASGVCGTPQSISATEATFQFPVVAADGVTPVNKFGEGRINLISDVDWFYSDTPGSGRKMLIAANQNLVIPFHDDLIIGAATVSGTGTLYTMLMDASKVR